MHELRKIQHTPEINETSFLQRVNPGSAPTFAEKTRGREMNTFASGDPEPVGPRWWRGGRFGPRSRTSGSDAKNGRVAK